MVGTVKSTSEKDFGPVLAMANEEEEEEEEEDDTAPWNQNIKLIC
jgi:hypothetical protein